MYSQDAFIKRTCLGFPAHVLVACFAFSPSFLSSVFFFLFNFCFRVYFFFKLPFFVLRFLVSSSCYFFFSNSSMADYFAVRVNCPSIAFFFTHLGSLLEFVEGECLERIGFFVGEDCPYTSVLSSLFPLVFHSTRVARLLKMVEVRPSDLRTGLFSSDDRMVSKAISMSTPIKLRTSRVPLLQRMSSESRIGFSSLIL